MDKKRFTEAFKFRQSEILVIDDDPTIRELYQEMFREADLPADVVGTVREGLDALGAEPYRLVIVDLKMPGWDGLTAIKAVSQGRPGLPMLVITGVGDPELHRRVKAHESVVGLLSKPFNPNDVVTRVRELLSSP
ncbi:MAG: response regulator [Planctomycetes bacterium]|nr:response regulator [Planctomycetota bacterium]